jgi:subtilase family serine protease
MDVLWSAGSNPRSTVLYSLLRRCPACWIVFCLCVFGVYGQSPNRIRRIIDLTRTAPLQGSVAPLARFENDIGRISGDTRLSGVTFYFKLTADEQSELDALVQAQQTPRSPTYHKWLTPADYASRFGLAKGDLEKIQTWLELQGFTIDRVCESRTCISFSGTVGQVELAFQTEIHRYKIDGETHFANATRLSIPIALADVIQSVRNLNDFRPKPQVRFHNAAPDFTSAQSGIHYLTPKDVATIYDVDAVYGSGYNGTGQSIAVVGQSEVNVSDIEQFQSAAGLTVKDPTLILVPGSGTAQYSQGDQAESDLDLEYSGGMGTGATIYFVYVGNSQNTSVFDAVQYAVDTRIAPIISISYGACETDLTANDFSTLESIMEQGASQGQSIIAASGDNGSTSCYGEQSLTTAQQEAIAVDYPASSAYVTGLGGTEFPSSDVSSSNTTYWQPASGSDIVSSAKSYIPEQTWNDDSSESGLAAGGGGVSALTARPGWQKGVTGIPSGNYRLVPDISLDSSPANAGYLYCTSDTSAWSQGQQASCNSGFRDSSSQALTVAGGTSFAAPIFAGMLTIINQKENSTGQGLVNSALYTLAANSGTYASAFHDITSGGNQCTAGSHYCSSAGQSEYSAARGYDMATGLGSIDLNNLLTAWPPGSSLSLESTITSLRASTSTPATGANNTISITVSPESKSNSATPTGTLTIVVDGTTETTSLALSSGSATYTFSSAVAGAHVIEATYSGDTTFASSAGSVTVNVGGSGGGSSGGTFTLSATNVTVSQGSSGTSTVTVTSQNSYAGTVGLTFTTTSTSLEQNGCYSVPNATVTANKTATTTLTIYTSKSACNSSSVSNGTRHSFVKAGTKPFAFSPASPAAHRAMPISFAIAIGGFVLLVIQRRESWLRAGLSCLVLAGILGMATGCGGGNGGSNSNDVAKGTYTFTLDGRDTSNSSIAASTTFTLTVQ